MAFRISTGLRTHLLEGTQGFKQTMDGCRMFLYTGSQPDTPESVETGTLLGIVGSAGLVWGTASSGSIDKNNVQWGGTCTVAGIAGWFRIFGTASTTGADSAGTSRRIDGAIGSVSGELVLNPTKLVVDAPIIISSFPVTIPMNQG